MTIGWERWGKGAVVVVSALFWAGCVKGVGDKCASHAECLPGLACVAGSCRTCQDGKGNPAACVPIDLVVKSCDPAANPLKDNQSPPEAVPFLRITITGDGISPPIVQVAALSAKQLVLSSVPFGKNRRIVVEAVEGKTAAEAKDATQPIARGASASFDVAAAQPVSSVTIYLRKVEELTKASGLAKPAVCSGLNVPRAGQTATTLLDGRVLIAGGYTYDSSGKKTYLNSAEIYDPRAGTFKLLPAHLNVSRAFHTASLLPDGRVLLAGGTSYINLVVAPLKTAELFDPASESFTYLVMNEYRTHHAAAVLPGGIVLLTGGYGGENPPATTNCDDIPCPVLHSPTDRTEFFDPRAPLAQAFQEGPTMSVARADQASLAVDQERVLVIGGTDGLDPLASVDVFNYLRGTFIREQTSSYSLASARANPLALLMDGGTGVGLGVLVAGAWADDPNNLRDAWDWLPVQLGGTPPGQELGQPPPSRTGACAASFEGGVLVAGGVDPSGPLNTADTYTVAPDGKIVAQQVGTLPSAVSHAACAALHDGTVLVTGGDEGGKVSGAAEFYEPSP